MLLPSDNNPAAKSMFSYVGQDNRNWRHEFVSAFNLLAANITYCAFPYVAFLEPNEAQVRTIGIACFNRGHWTIEFASEA